MGIVLGLLGIALMAYAPLAPNDRAGRQPGMSVTPRLLLVQSKPTVTQTARGTMSGWRQELRPIDPQTLTDLPGYTPLPLGTRYSSAFSHDGQMLAILTSPDHDMFGPASPESQRTYTLRLLDLARWQERPMAIIVTGAIDWFSFAIDDRHLYWIVAIDGNETAPAQREYTLYRYALGAKGAEVVTRLPRGIIGEAGHDLRLLRSGHQLVFYDQASATNGQPQLRFLDLVSGQFVTTLPLAGVHTGTKMLAVGEESFSPGLAWDTAHDRLYIAHADADAITAVDLLTHAVIGQTKIGDGTPVPTYDLESYSTVSRPDTTGHSSYRYAMIDTTGEILIVSGRVTTTEPLPGGRWQVRDQIGIPRAITTTTFGVNGYLPERSAVLAATERGILINTVHYVNSYPSLEPGDFQLRLLDPGDLHELWRVDTAPGDIWPAGISPGDRFVYLFSPNNGGFTLHVEASEHVGNTLGVFDLATRRLIGERIMPQGYILMPSWSSR